MSERRPLLTKKQFATYWGVSEGTVDEWARKGKVHPVRTPGGYPRYPEPDERAERPE